MTALVTTPKKDENSLPDVSHLNFKTPEEVLKHFYGFDKFRGIQKEAITSILDGTDTIGFMSTGGGKSLIFIIPALMFSGLTLVVSPLISLQQDQAEALLRKGIPAAVLNSDLGVRAKAKLKGQLERKEVKLLYVAPETLLTDWCKDLLKDQEINFIAIDEAGCCSSWGDFRPQYTKIHELRLQDYLEKAVMFCCTATADEHIKEDIVNNCGLKPDYKLFQASFDRPSINYHVIPSKSSGNLKNVLKLIKAHGPDDVGFIYSGTRAQAEELSDMLNRLGFNSLAYHAAIKNTKGIKGPKGKDLSAKDYKAWVLSQYVSGKVKILVASIAAGLGMDVPNIRYCILLDTPHNIDDLAQIIGRASRDGLPSSAYLLYDPASKGKSQFMIRKSTFNPDRLAIKIKKLNAIHQFCASKSCRRKGLLEYFGEPYLKDNCNSCDNCGIGVGVNE